MRIRLAIVALVVIPALYLLARPSSHRAEAARAPAPSAPAEAKNQLREQIAAQAQARDRINARLAELEGRLDAMEQQDPVPAEQVEGTAAPRNDLSDSDMATWMDHRLQAASDPAVSQQASAQLNATIAQVKRMDLHVEKVSCGERFCRASFYQDNGERPVVRDIYGAPPITGEGFTIQEPDGRLGVYFARNGEHVSDFRDEALLASAP